MLKKLKKISTEWKNKINWFKSNRNNTIYKICVLLGLTKSPSYEMHYHTDDSLKNFIKQNSNVRKKLINKGGIK